MSSSPQNTLTRDFRIKRADNKLDPDKVSVIDTVALEEPLDMRIQYSAKQSRASHSVALAMRTPGNDRELIAGFLLSEGVIHSARDLREIRTLGIPPSNEIVAELAEHVDVETWRANRNTILNSSCGICGKQSIDSLISAAPAISKDTFRIDAAVVRMLPDLLRNHQEGFARTGGLHAAALVTPSGEFIRVFEDIGRHNALDKLLGWCLLHEMTPLERYLLFMSSRSSFELVGKALAAGAPALATVGGPSSLAIETARAHGLTLLGFVRDSRFNIYSADWRINS